jgi:hypothetical protein
MILRHILLIISIQGKVMFSLPLIAPLFFLCESPIIPLIPLISTPFLALLRLLLPLVVPAVAHLAPPTRALVHLVV